MFEQATAKLAAGEALTFRHGRGRVVFATVGLLILLSLGWLFVWLLYNDIIGPVPRYGEWRSLAVLFGMLSVVGLVLSVKFLIKPFRFAVLTPTSVTHPYVGTVSWENIHGFRYAQKKNGGTRADLIAVDIDLEGQHDLEPREEREKANLPLAFSLALSERSDSVLILDCGRKRAEQFLAVLQWAHERFSRQDSSAG